jgi:hypothetical protein
MEFDIHGQWRLGCQYELQFSFAFPCSIFLTRLSECYFGDMPMPSMSCFYKTQQLLGTVVPYLDQKSISRHQRPSLSKHYLTALSFALPLKKREDFPKVIERSVGMPPQAQWQGCLLLSFSRSLQP